VLLILVAAHVAAEGVTGEPIIFSEANVINPFAPAFDSGAWIVKPGRIG
jgi:hypothetical protein